VIYYLVGAIVLMLIGIIGVVLPVLPGLPLMFVVALVFHFFVKPLSLWAIGVFALITAISFLIDHLSGVLGSKFFGASRRSMLIGFVAMLVGLIIFPPFGAIIGLFAGIFASELISKKDERKALKAASGGLLSVVLGIILNLILAIGFFVIFLVSAI